MRVFWLIIAGLFGGVLGGMGMGGGTLLIPILSIFLDVPHLQAQGINLISFVPMSIVALIFHFKNKLVLKKYFFKMGITGVLFSILGAYLSSITQVELLRKLFGVFLILLGILSLIVTIVQIKRKKLQKSEENKGENEQNEKN